MLTLLRPPFCTKGARCRVNITQTRATGRFVQVWEHGLWAVFFCLTPCDQLRRCFPIASGKRDRDRDMHEINGQIRDKEVRVIDADGSQLGVMQTQDALRLAESRELDLVKIAPQANPPVVKILDYGKFRFEQQKKEKETRKNQKTVEIKEIRLGLHIDVADFNTKVGHARKFLEKGDKVKVSIRFRGREMAHQSQGLEVHRRFAEALPEAVVERPPKLDGRQMIMFLAPEKEKEAPKSGKKKDGEGAPKPPQEAPAKPAAEKPAGAEKPAAQTPPAAEPPVAADTKPTPGE